MLIVHIVYSFVYVPEGILLPFGYLDLLGFVFFSSANLAHLRERSSCRALQACVLAGIASQNIKGQCCTQLLLLLSVCQFQDDFRGLLLSLQPPMQFPYLCLYRTRERAVLTFEGAQGAVVLFDPLHCFPRRDALHVFSPTLWIPNHNCSPLWLLTEKSTILGLVWSWNTAFSKHHHG